nr:MAG TPA: hypothetical protein [Caudoviricetes sp.]
MFEAIGTNPRNSGTKRGTQFLLLRREKFRKMSLRSKGNRNRNRGALLPPPVTL